jgi:hypothetical protein
VQLQRVSLPPSLCPRFQYSMLFLRATISANHWRLSVVVIVSIKALHHSREPVHRRRLEDTNVSGVRNRVKTAADST